MGTFSFTFALPTRIIFGAHAFERSVGPETRRLGKRAFVVTGRSSAEKSGLLDAAVKLLEAEKVRCRVFSGIEPNPTVESAHRGAAQLKNFGADVVVAIGGGSVIDAAKAIGVAAVAGGGIQKYFGAGKVPAPNMPLVAAPTTSGTGSEVTQYSVISDPEAGTKNLIKSMNICPTTAIVDPVLAMGMPPELAAASGIDALSHAVESYVCAVAQPVTDLVNIEAVSLIAKHLPASVNLQGDYDSRCMMAYAALLGGIGINNSGTGLAHLISFPLTADYGIPHGVATGLVLPYVMEFNLPANYTKFARIARAMGEDTTGLSVADAAKMSVSAVKRLLRDVRFPASLAGFGVEDKKIKEYAPALLADKGRIANNPRVPRVEDIVTVCMKAKDIGTTA
ncbi:MAG: iron-containing alcohol dehydrogenase [bacterium]